MIHYSDQKLYGKDKNNIASKHTEMSFKKKQSHMNWITNSY